MPTLLNTDSEVSGVVSIASMFLACLLQVVSIDIPPNIMHWLQATAWIVAIISGLITIVRWFILVVLKKNKDASKGKH